MGIGTLRRHREVAARREAANEAAQVDPQDANAPEAGTDNPPADIVPQDGTETPDIIPAETTLVDVDGDGDVGLVCPDCDPPRDFKTKAALASHSRVHAEA